MTRTEALEIAKLNRKAYTTADMDHIMGRGPAPDPKAFGYRHGWYKVGNFSFNHEHLTGQPYDVTQGGWAFL